MASKGTLSPELLLQLEILRAIPGTSSVNDFGVEGEGKPNTYGVLLKLQAPIVAGSQTEQKPLRVACSKDRATKLDAALQMKKNVAAIVGEDAVEQAERLIMERQASCKKRDRAMASKRRRALSPEHLPPSLLPPFRATSALATSSVKAIIDHAHEFAPTSPHQRDVVKRQTGACTSEEKLGLILLDTREAMFADFQMKKPTINIAYSTWKGVLKREVW